MTGSTRPAIETMAELGPGADVRAGDYLRTDDGELVEVLPTHPWVGATAEEVTRPPMQFVSAHRPMPINEDMPPPDARPRPVRRPRPADDGPATRALRAAWCDADGEPVDDAIVIVDGTGDGDAQVRIGAATARGGGYVDLSRRQALDLAAFLRRQLTVTLSGGIDRPMLNSRRSSE